MVSLPSHHQSEHDDETIVTPKTPASRSQTGIVVVLIVLILLLIGLLLMSNREKFSWYFSTDDQGSGAMTWTMSGDFFVGKEIWLSGTLLQQGDLTTYTHTLILSDGQMLGLKSTTLALNQYSGDVIVGGSIVDLIQGMYVADVQTIVPIPREVEAIETGDLEKIENAQLTGSTYVADAGMFVDDRLLPGIQVTPDYANKKIVLAANGQTITISYFTCSKKNADEDCATLTKTFRDAGAELVWTSPDGDEFREMPETTSIFGSLQSKIGYYIQASDKSFLVNTLNAVTFVTDRSVRAQLEETATKLCRNDDGILATIDNVATMAVDDGGMLAVVKWKTVTDEIVTCRIAYDPSYELGGTMMDMTISMNSEEWILNNEQWITTWASSSSSISSTSSTVSTLVRDPSVVQVPTSTAKTYTHTGKDYTIIFPSTNLWYDRVPVTGDKTLWFPGLSCHGKFHIIAYEKDATIRDAKMLNEPKAIIYACADNEKLAQTVSSSFVITRQIDKKRMFLAQPVDPSWYDFITQTVISELAE